MSKINKVERYDWAKPGDRGRQCRISVDELQIDYTYQREEVSNQNTLAIAGAFSWVAFGSIVVMERDTGEKFVVDGQQRLAAVKRRGDISEVPCLLFRSDGREHEAKAFIALNVLRAYVSAVAKFQAGVYAGLSPEAEIAAWLATQGLEVSRAHGRSLNSVDFPYNLVTRWKMDPEKSKEAILIQREIDKTEPLHSMIHKGVFWLLRKGVDVAAHVEKIKRLGGRTAIFQSIKTLEIEAMAKASERICGVGILRLINHRRRRNKIRVSEEE